MTPAMGADDGPWAALAQSLLQEAKAGRPVYPALARLSPGLKKQIDSDSHFQDFKNLWGQSLNFDEHAQATIVETPLIEAISQAMAVAAPKGHVVHAGTEHTYGYLLSLLKTPYGYKRARWVENEIEIGFGLPIETFNPNTKEGTLFSNVTFFMGNIAFRSHPGHLRTLRANQSHVPDFLPNFQYSKLEISRIEETAGKIKLWTDLVPFTGPTARNGDSYLLIYSIQERLQDAPKLITAFPIQKSFAQNLMDKKNMVNQIPITTRYNGYIQGLSGKTVLGSRKLIAPAH